MKKISLVAFLFLLSFQLTSQTNPEQQAGEMTKEMVIAVSLDENQKSNLYLIQLKRFKDAKLIRQKFRDQPNIKNAELKKVNNRLYESLQELLGKELMHQWRNYKLKKN